MEELPQRFFAWRDFVERAGSCRSLQSSGILRPIKSSSAPFLMPLHPISFDRRYGESTKPYFDNVRNSLVEDSQGDNPSRFKVSFEKLSIATAWSRDTVGKFTRNSSSETPSAELFMRASTGTRVPANTGVPLMISGSIVIGRLSTVCSSITKLMIPDSNTSRSFFPSV